MNLPGEGSGSDHVEVGVDDIVMLVAQVEVCFI